MVAAIFALVVLFVVAAVDCAHQPAGWPQTAAIPGFQIVSLGQSDFTQLEFNILVDDIFLAWARVFPEADQDLYLAFEDNPIAFILVPGTIGCAHTAAATQWPGTPPECVGLWFVGSKNLFIDYRGGRLACTSIAHELSHLLSYVLFLDADGEHTRPEIWGRKGIVARLKKDNCR
jgi:hypothetical protein